MVDHSIKFWLLLSELNSLTTIMSIELPEYQERISRVKSELTEIIEENLELSKKVRKIEVDSWYERNN